MKGTSLEPRARAPPIFLPFVLFRLVADDRCDRPDMRAAVTYMYILL